jgi:hypothetical protein
MSNSEHETSADQTGIEDERLPEDLRPTEDNPLAEGLDEGDTVDDLLEGGKKAEQMEERDESEDSDTRNE